MLAVRGLVAVPFNVPGKDSHLIEIIGQPVMRFGEHGEILRNFFIAVLHLAQYEESYEALPFGVLRDFDGHVNVHHSRQNPAHTSRAIATQPPVFERWSR